MIERGRPAAVRNKPGPRGGVRAGEHFDVRMVCYDRSFHGANGELHAAEDGDA